MYIASASSTIKFHKAGKLVRNYQPGATKISGPIRSISWSRSSNWLAVVPHTGLTEIVYCKDNVKLMHTIQHVEQPTCVAFQNTTKKLLALGTNDGQIVIYNLKSQSIEKQFTRTLFAISHIGFTAKDTHVVAGCAKNGDILLYNNITSNLSHKFNIPKSESVTALRTNPIKSNLIMAGSKEGSVAVWDSNVNQVKFFMEARKSPVTSVAFSPIDSTLAIVTSLDGQFSFYDVEKHTCLASFAVDNSLMAVDFSKDGTHFGTASQDGIVYIYDLRNLKKSVKSFQAHNEAILHLAFQGTFNRNVSADSTSTNGSFLEFVPETPGNQESLDLPRSSDFFGINFMRSPVKDDNITFSKPADNYESFMAEIGLKKDHLEEDHLKVLEEDHLEVLNEELAPNPDKLLNKKVGLLSKSSTSLFDPLKLDWNLPASSIPSCSEKYSNVDELHSLLAGVVREEIYADMEKLTDHWKTHTEEVKKGIADYQVSATIKAQKPSNGKDLIADAVGQKSAPKEEIGTLDTEVMNSSDSQPHD